MKNILGKSLLAIALAACSAQVVEAMPAYPYPVQVRQADGTMLTILQRGDEHGNWMLTTDGKPLLFNVATGNYEYAKLMNGTLQASGIKATEAGQRTAQAKAFLQSQDAEGILQLCRQNRAARLAKAAGARRQALQKSGSDVQSHRLTNYPVKGQVHSLVILVQFSDTKFTTVGDDATQFYKDMLNKQGFTYSNGAEGSARDFYVDSSDGVFLPTFDVVGPVTLPETCFYYGTNLGKDDNPARLEEFVRQACTLADPQVNFADYDNNGDGYVDNIYFFYAGYGAADSGESRTIWPHASSYWEMASQAGLTTTTLTLDNVNIGSYSCSNEIIGTLDTAQPAGIGNFVHEFGHVLGLADHYDVDYGTTTFDPALFDTMAMGSYCNNGNTPPAFSAYERACLGWTDLIELKAGTDTLNILPDLKDSNKAYRVSVDGTKGNEFFVLENRQQKGWDTYLPGHGMLMWHIDYDKDAWEADEVNIMASHQRVDIVEADNRRNYETFDGDPFPGASNVTKWQLTSWADEKVLSLDDIEEKDGEIRLMLGDLDLKLATPQIDFQTVADSSVVLSWDAVAAAKEYVLNVYEKKDGNKTVLPAYTDKMYSDAGQIEVTGLSPETDYEFSLKAQRGSYSSDVYTEKVTTTAVPFSKYYVTHLYADNVEPDGFTASWTGIDAADDYEVTLSKMVYDATGQQKGYDFSDELNGLPQSWTTDGMVNTSTYGAAAPSLRLNKVGSSLVVAYPDEKITSVSFHVQSSGTTKATLTVSVLRNGEWTSIFQADGSNDAVKAGLDPTLNFDEADAVKLEVEARTSGAFFLDDVYAVCHQLQLLPVEGYDGVSTGGKTTFAFTGLEKGTHYSLTVRGKQGSELSYPSEQLVVDTPTSSGIQQVGDASEASDAQRREYYDLNGRKVQPSQMSQGVYVVRQGNKTYKFVR